MYGAMQFRLFTLMILVLISAIATGGWLLGKWHAENPVAPHSQLSLILMLGLSASSCVAIYLIGRGKPLKAMLGGLLLGMAWEFSHLGLFAFAGNLPTVFAYSTPWISFFGGMEVITDVHHSHASRVAASLMVSAITSWYAATILFA